MSKKNNVLKDKRYKEWIKNKKEMKKNSLEGIVC